MALPATFGPQSAPVKILAYGDSLTAGYHMCGLYFKPYAQALQACLGPGVQVAAVGLSGWTTTEMVRDLDAESVEDVTGREGCGLGRLMAEAGGYGVAILLAGTNDIVYTGLELAKANLKTLHEVCHRHGAKTVAIGIPEGRVQLSSESMQRYRAAVNTWLQDWASSSETSGRVLYLDFPIPFSDDTGDWEGDGLHMSAQGYQKLGRLLGPLIRNFVGCSERELAAGS